MGRRVFLFILTNLLVIATLTIVMSLLGVGPYITQYGLDYTSLAIFCGIWGMGGAFISLALSKKMAKWMMKVQIIDPNTTDPTGATLVRTIHNLAKAAALPKMPDVGIYHSPEVNAFATGPSKSNSLVAVSTGLLQRMGKEELEGVLGHEIAHIANGDMVTMTLIQGVINAFVMFFARIVAFAVSSFLRGDDDEGPGYMDQFLLIMVFQVIFGLFGSLVVAYFSRAREFKADSGSARLAGRGKMISALQALSRTTELIDNEHKAMATLKIAGSPSGFAALFMTHPPLEKRIEALKMMT